jgi:hypothetical protein
MLVALIAVLALLSVGACLAQPAQAPAQAQAQPAFKGTLRAPISPPPVENVLLIGWDGVQRHRLLELMVAGRLPNLWALIEEGSIETIGVTGHATDTKSGWTQILTGYDPDVTGVYSNGRYQPIPEGLSVFERAQQAFGRENIFTMMVNGKAVHVGSKGPGEPTGGPRGQQTEKLGQPFYNTRKALDVWDGDKQRDAPDVGAAAISALEKAGGKRFLAFVHFSDPDHRGHASGENSPEYEQAIITCDEWLGKLTQWVKDKGLYERTRIYVVTDHGFDEGEKSHRYAPRTWLATNDNAVMMGGHMHDITATLLVRMGVDISKLEPAYPGHALIDAVPFLKQPARVGMRAGRARTMMQ